MGESEWRLFRKLLDQAKALKHWTPSQTLEDTDNECHWTKINDDMKWGPITKVCTYEQTFISLLEDYLAAHPEDAKANDGVQDIEESESTDEDFLELFRSRRGRKGRPPRGVLSDLDRRVIRQQQPRGRPVPESEEGNFEDTFVTESSNRTEWDMSSDERDPSLIRIPAPKEWATQKEKND